MTDQTAQAETMTAAEPVSEKSKSKTERFRLPFQPPIFSRPDREVKVERTDKKGNKTGVTSYLVCDLAVPLEGGIGVVRSSIWREEKFDREANQFTDTYSFSLPRNSFNIVDGRRVHYDEWRQSILLMYDRWSETEAGKSGAKNAWSSSPRLVKVRPGTTTQPASTNEVLDRR